MAGLYEPIRSSDLFLGALPTDRIAEPEEPAGTAPHVAGLAAGAVPGARGGAA